MKVKEIFSVSLNEILIIVYLQLILMLSFRKFLVKLFFETSCDFEIRKDIEIRLENIFIMFLMNLCLAVCLIKRKNNPLKLVWNMESYGAFFKIYYIMMLHFIVDFNLQYYLYVYNLKKV